MLGFIRRFRWHLILGIAVAVGGSASVFLLRDASGNAADIGAATKVIEGVRPASPIGFEPAVWEQASDKDAVLPAGATLEVVPSTWDIRGDVASVDVTMTVPGKADQRHWLFLRRHGVRWLISGSMPLDGER